MLWRPVVSSDTHRCFPSLLPHTVPFTVLTYPSVPSPILAIGAVAERGRLWPLIFFVFAWSTLVYDPIACWVRASAASIYENTDLIWDS
jgi:ammonia channel protein AmtB